jgi:hypothetical protein
MTRSRSHEPVRLREKVFVSPDEITQAMEKLRARITQVDELKKEGLAYRDALRTTAEFQIRDTIKEIFGDKSPEFHEYQHHRVKAGSKTEVNATISLLQDLISSLEHRLKVLQLGPGASESGPIEPSPTRLRAAESVEPSTPPAPPPLRVVPPVQPRPSSQTQSSSVPPGTHGHTKKSAQTEKSPGLAAVQTANDGSTGGAVKASSRSRSEKGDALPLIRKVCLRFHSVVRQLRMRSEDRTPFEVEDETDVRDLLRALLSMEFEDITVEEWTPGYANGAARPVILLRPEGIMIEVKKTRPGLAAKELNEQAMIDFREYPGLDCRTAFCFIYDPEGRIPNPRRLESELTGQLQGRTTELLVSPK